MNYAEYLQSSHWRLFRATAKKYYKTCYVCGTSKNLHVHHLRYWKNGESILYKETLPDVRVLCKRDHFKGQMDLNTLHRLRATRRWEFAIRLLLSIPKKLIQLLFRTK